jgi:hypothetical protein
VRGAHIPEVCAVSVWLHDAGTEVLSQISKDEAIRM